MAAVPNLQARDGGGEEEEELNMETQTNRGRRCRPWEERVGVAAANEPTNAARIKMNCKY